MPDRTQLRQGLQIEGHGVQIQGLEKHVFAEKAGNTTSIGATTNKSRQQTPKPSIASDSTGSIQADGQGGQSFNESEPVIGDDGDVSYPHTSASNDQFGGVAASGTEQMMEHEHVNGRTGQSAPKFTRNANSKPKAPQETIRKLITGAIFALGVLILCLFAIWIRKQSNIILRSWMPRETIYASRYSDEYKHRPAVSPMITSTMSDGRINIHGAAPTSLSQPVPSIIKKATGVRKRPIKKKNVQSRAKKQPVQVPVAGIPKPDL